MSSTMSILGLYDYDNTIFDQMALPAEINTNKNTLIDNLLMECAEFEILYTDPNFMKYAIKSWSGMMVGIWEKQLATTKFEYDPIANYNRFEFYKDITDRTDKTTYNSTHKTEYDITDKTDYDITDTLTNGKTETISQNSYENAGLVTAAQTANSGTDSNRKAGYDSTRKAGYDSLGRTGDDTLDIDNTFTHDAHMSGNIGVTSTQDMIKQEREVVLYNMFEIIISDFKERFCLMIY